jgi:peptidoglycan/xylan/chitin deacetylase (PgdA/CDA1 family)
VVEPSPLPPTPATIPSGSPLQPNATLPESLRGKEWVRLPTSRKIVALTFDAGAGDEGIRSIIATLTRENVPGTFFLSGRWAQAFPAGLESIVAMQANSIGNHTYSHPQLPALSDDQVRREVSGADAILRSMTGRNPRPLFRFPYGASDTRTVRLVNELDYGSIRWTVDTLGWRGTSAGESADNAVTRVIDHLVSGEIVLMHVGAARDGSIIDADALPHMIAEIRNRGYGFVAIWDFLYSGSAS